VGWNGNNQWEWDGNEKQAKPGSGNGTEPLGIGGNESDL